MYKHFSEEGDPRLFTCSETGEQGIDPEFVAALDKLRTACDFPFIINSGYRSPLHSKEAVKDEPGEHTRGAADVRVDTAYKRFIIVKRAIHHGFTGIGIGKKFVHLDKRQGLPKMWHYY